MRHLQNLVSYSALVGRKQLGQLCFMLTASISLSFFAQPQLLQLAQPLPTHTITSLETARTPRSILLSVSQACYMPVAGVNSLVLLSS